MKIALGTAPNSHIRLYSQDPPLIWILSIIRIRWQWGDGMSLKLPHSFAIQSSPAPEGVI